MNFVSRHWSEVSFLVFMDQKTVLENDSYPQIHGVHSRDLCTGLCKVLPSSGNSRLGGSIAQIHPY